MSSWSEPRRSEGSVLTSHVLRILRFAQGCHSLVKGTNQRANAPRATRNAQRATRLTCPLMTSGRQFLQIPGPTNIPERVLRAMDRPVVDHRSPEFAELTEDVRAGLRRGFC